MAVSDVRNNKILRCTIINGRTAGEEISIPIIKQQPQGSSNQPCEWDILQFPVRLTYAMTIDKSQGKGQTLANAGVELVTSVFGRGQLYDAAPRTDACSSANFAVMPYKVITPLLL
jgi:hypothetical protein